MQFTAATRRGRVDGDCPISHGCLANDDKQQTSRTSISPGFGTKKPPAKTPSSTTADLTIRLFPHVPASTTDSRILLSLEKSRGFSEDESNPEVYYVTSNLVDGILRMTT